MILSINEVDKCWVCGEQKKNITTHHAIPKHLKPINNVTIPVCEECHKKINSSDITGMYSYLFKIKQSIRQNVQSVNVALSTLDDIKTNSQIYKKGSK